MVRNESFGDSEIPHAGFDYRDKFFIRDIADSLKLITLADPRLRANMVANLFTYRRVELSGNPGAELVYSSLWYGASSGQDEAYLAKRSIASTGLLNDQRLHFLEDAHRLFKPLAARGAADAVNDYGEQYLDLAKGQGGNGLDHAYRNFGLAIQAFVAGAIYEYPKFGATERLVSAVNELTI